MDISFNTLNIAIALILIILVFIWIRSRRPSDLPPGPTPVPVLGNLTTLFTGDLRAVAKVMRQKYGNLFSLSLGPYWVIFVCGSDALKEVFVKQGEIFSDRPDVYYSRHIKKLKGIAYAYPWKRQRQFTLNLLKGFGFTNRSLESTITDETGHFVEVLGEQRGKPVCIIGSINKAVSNVICSIVLGKRFDYDDKEFERFVHVITETVVNKYIPKVNLLPILRIIPKVRKSLKHCEDENVKIREWFQSQIDEHKKALDENNIKDFIDAFLVEIRRLKDETNSQFTEENLKYVILDLFSAGTETTSTTIQWAVLYLANYPDVQEKIRKEILQNVSSRAPTLEDRNNLPYCQAVIAEIQRLGNILPMSIPHTASKDANVFGFRIPKGAIVIPCLDSVMHDETVFPDSNRFNPERFLNDRGQLCNVENILPYSLGRRVCLGEALARNEVFLFFTSIVYKYKILPPTGEKPPPIVGRLGITHGPTPFVVRFLEHDQLAM